MLMQTITPFIHQSIKIHIDEIVGPEQAKVNDKLNGLQEKLKLLLTQMYQLKKDNVMSRSQSKREMFSQS